MNSTIFILVPSPHPTGPIKGAFALANAIAPSCRVVLTYLKDGPGVDAELNARVEEISLAHTSGGWLGRLRAYKKLLRNAGGRENVGSISMCFSADLLNRFCAEDAIILSSVRGNLPQNYQYDYGMIGSPLAIIHMIMLRGFDHVIAMTEAMARQIYYNTGVRPKIIGNFIDEQALDSYRRHHPFVKDRFHFVYVGSLTKRKQPHLIVQAIKILINQGYDIKLDIIGDGPLRDSILTTVVKNGLHEHVQLCGWVGNPYPLIAAADALILPSRSEGVSRAALEALYLGVPCVLRNVDGNAELLSEPGAGVLFSKDIELSPAMAEIASRGRTRAIKSSLLPPSFRQSLAALQYLKLFEDPV